jgi:hypothetical protein
VADAAYAGQELSKLPPGITWTTRLRKDAALYEPPPTRTGRRGRPRAKGTRLPCLNSLARHATFAPATVTRYQKTATEQAAAVTCLWYGVFGPRLVQIVLIRDAQAAGYDLALVTTDLDASPAQAIERYAARWSIEVAIEEARQVFGAGQARNRTARAAERTIRSSSPARPSPRPGTPPPGTTPSASRIPCPTRPPRGAPKPGSSWTLTVRP